MYPQIHNKYEVCSSVCLAHRCVCVLFHSFVYYSSTFLCLSGCKANAKLECTLYRLSSKCVNALVSISKCTQIHANCCLSSLQYLQIAVSIVCMNTHDDTVMASCLHLSTHSQRKHAYTYTYISNTIATA